MKKVLSVLICAILLFAFTACSEEEKPATSYDELLTKLKDSVDSLFDDDFDKQLEEGKLVSPTGELTDKWVSMLKDAKADFPNVDENAFGYKMADINSDGNHELFFMRSDERILAVFTMCDGKPLMVDAFNRVYRCVLRDTGELYTMTVRDDGGYEFKIHTLNSANGTLMNTVNFGTENGICYEMLPDGIYTTSTERISELSEQYPFESASVLTEMELNLF